MLLSKDNAPKNIAHISCEKLKKEMIDLLMKQFTAQGGLYYPVYRDVILLTPVILRGGTERSAGYDRSALLWCTWDIQKHNFLTESVHSPDFM